LATVREHEQMLLPGAEVAPWLRILSYARPYLGFVALALALTLGAAVAEFGRAYLLKLVVDEVALPQGALLSGGDFGGMLPDLPFLPDRDEGPAEAAPLELDPEQRATIAQNVRDNLIFIVVVAAVIVVVLPLLSFSREYVKAYSLGRIHVDMTRDACAKLLALPLRFHHGRKRGDVYARIGSDLGRAHSALDLLFSDVASSMLTIAVGTCFLVYISWQLSLTMLVVLPLLFGVVSFFGKRIRFMAGRRQRQVGEVTQRMLEILSGIKVIKAFRGEAAEDAAYRRATRKLFRRSIKVTQNRILARAFVDFLNQVMTLGGLCLGGLMLLRGMWGLSLGDLVAFFMISGQTYRPLKKLAKAWVRIVDAFAGAERFLEVMDAPIEIRDAPDAVEIGPARHSVSMRGVTFAYADQSVLYNVSFEARAGEVVAIVGRTGAGKTTLTDLIMRLYDPDAGSIEIDGVDLRRVKRDSLLAQIAVVTQEPFLFDGSIRENLRYGRPDATEDEVLAAARAAHVDEIARELPERYDTEVGSGGVRLSGGQRQRITIGRAILKDPSILILDEATSALDSKSEKYVQEAIDALLGGNRTVFVIAHRLSTIRRADRILVIEGGHITQQGTHAELMRRGGLYRELVDLQTSTLSQAS
jgi:subfamily B ATP-binding cassette protein MsbA